MLLNFLNEKSLYDNALNKPVDFVSKNGYSFQATNFLAKNFANESDNTAFLDTKALLVMDNNDELNSVMKNALGDNDKVFAGEIYIYPHHTTEGTEDGFDALDALLINSLLAPRGSEDEIPSLKFVAPLTIGTSDKEPHGVAFCFDFNAQKNKANIIILEQHAHKKDKNEVNYNPSLDYSQEIEKTLKYFKERLESADVATNTFYNKEPICREKGVCGIVSMEVCNRLLNAENPMELAQSGNIKISKDDVVALHNQNVNKYETEQLKIASKNKNQARINAAKTHCMKDPYKRQEPPKNIDYKTLTLDAKALEKMKAIKANVK